jgi:hypothetical protein
MDTRSREIAPNQWRIFFDEISRHYRGRCIELLHTSPGQGTRALAKDLPLIGFTLEPNPTGTPTLSICAGSGRGKSCLVSHVVPGPLRVWMKQEANGGDNAMGIESADGSMLVVEFAGDTGRR